MSKPANREELAARFGETWTTDEADALFNFIDFQIGGHVRVLRRDNGQEGFISFWDNSNPPYDRYYFNWRKW